MSNVAIHSSNKLGKRRLYVAVKGDRAAIYIMKPDNWDAMRTSGKLVTPLLSCSVSELNGELHELICEIPEGGEGEFDVCF